ncbi:enediyne antibiotic chromoprotein [Streptomyces polychromogenes]|uniref:Enediyne antibiotic chromoprotein n=1 Tax=Streptomyces polychromogenes TaxID=67342 RepID=A0ABN0VFS2_9ACTN
MKYPQTARTAGKGLALAGAGLAATLALSTSAFAAPSLSLGPGAAAADGAKVTVTGSGYTPGSTIVLLECDADKPQGTACDKPGLVATTADARGDIKATFTVRARFKGSDLTGGGATADVDCSAGHCAIGATDASRPGTQGAGVALTFG